MMPGMARRTVSGLRIAGTAAVILLAVSALPAGAQTAIPAGLVGEWVGRTVEAEPPLGEFGEPARLTVEAKGSGFTLGTALGELRPLGVTMAATAQPGVFGPSAGGGVLSMFRADDPPDPLAGEPLQWARLSGDQLIVYVFAIEKTGSFILDRYVLARDGEELTLQLGRRTGVDDEHRLVARLARAS